MPVFISMRRRHCTFQFAPDISKSSQKTLWHANTKKAYFSRHFSLLGTCWLARRIYLHLHNASLLVNLLIS